MTRAAHAVVHVVKLYPVVVYQNESAPTGGAAHMRATSNTISESVTVLLGLRVAVTEGCCCHRLCCDGRICRFRCRCCCCCIVDPRKEE